MRTRRNAADEENAPFCFENLFEIHLWLLGGNDSDSVDGKMSDGLSADERRRAENFIFSADRRAFIRRRRTLREILGLYLEIEPVEVKFRYTSFGKPQLAPEINPDELHFNVSRAENIVVCAVAKRLIGADVEALADCPSNHEIAERFFAESELRSLEKLRAEDELGAAFYRCWTRKEAVLKAIGDGLSLPLDSFAVSTGAEIFAPVSFSDPNIKDRNWRTLTFSFASKYVVSAAFAGEISRLKIFDRSKTS